VVEGREIDYKQEFHPKSGDDNKELLYDISSFANASGGYLVFGVCESDGIPIAIRGIETSLFDDEKLRINNLLRDGVEPRIPVVQMGQIKVDSERSVLIIHIGKSWTAPHMVKYKKTSRFYSRNSVGKYPLDFGEIRSAFLQSESITERIRGFRTERLAKIIANETPVNIPDRAKVVLHLVPVVSFSSQFTSLFSNPSVEEYSDLSPLKGPSQPSLTQRLNFDGFLRYSPPQVNGYSVTYNQLFRNGVVESVHCNLIGDEHGNGGFIRIHYIEWAVLELLERVVPYLLKTGIEPPIAVMLTLTGVKGLCVPSGQTYLSGSDAIDRDNLFVPEIIVDNIETTFDIAMRPAFDAIWNAAGLPCSRTYNSEGRLPIDGISL
jgi:hypothetical protein